MASPDDAKRQLLNSLSRLTKVRRTNPPNPAPTTPSQPPLTTSNLNPPLRSVPKVPQQTTKPAAITTPRTTNTATTTTTPRAPPPALTTPIQRVMRSPSAVISSPAMGPPSLVPAPQTLLPPSVFLKRTGDPNSQPPSPGPRIPGPAGFMTSGSRTVSRPSRLAHSTATPSGKSPLRALKDRVKQGLSSRSPVTSPSAPRLQTEESIDDAYEMLNLKDSDFEKPTWLTLLSELGLPAYKPSTLEQLYPTRFPHLQYNMYTLVQRRPDFKIPYLLAVVREIKWTDIDASVTLVDPTGEMPGTIHRAVLEAHPHEIGAGTSLLLTDVSLFRPTKRSLYLNITTRNVAYVCSLAQQMVHNLGDGQSEMTVQAHTWKNPDFQPPELVEAGPPLPSTQYPAVSLPVARQLFPVTTSEPMRTATDITIVAPDDPLEYLSPIAPTPVPVTTNSGLAFNASSPVMMTPLPALDIDDNDDEDADLMFLLDTME
ncbi:hypothetical protein H4R34_001288 [Dimargaris verticillata]|uniref:Homologous recombination OB-fold protein OB-fold domain-containing protein n=1 Tax=Dimargaris verticillata TaxID=2761393 RepID=A0A9W8EF45_9FUNG|nr:hypothetical protein H4R34_001288 [Dimargaris verticillata]